MLHLRLKEHYCFCHGSKTPSLGPIRLTSDVNRPCQGHVSFSNSTKEGAVVNQPSDAIVHHNFSQVLVVQDVGVYERT